MVGTFKAFSSVSCGKCIVLLFQFVGYSTYILNTHIEEKSRLRTFSTHSWNLMNSLRNRIRGRHILKFVEFQRKLKKNRPPCEYA